MNFEVSYFIRKDRGKLIFMLFLLMSILEVEKTLMYLKMIQYVNPRYPPVAEIDQYAPDHPISFEPEFNCKKKICRSCQALTMCRHWTNSCYQAQHRVCTVPEINGKPLFS